MEALIIIFIIIVLIIALFCVTIVTREIIIEEKERRKTVEKTTEITHVEERTFQSNVVKSEPVVSEPSSVSVEDDSNVKFDAMKKTLDEKYLELESAYRFYYDEIVKTAMAVENYKRFKNDSYEEYKVGKNRIVRLRIKRGVVIAELLIPNLALKNYISDNKVEAKMEPTIFKVEDNDTLNAVKDSISIAVKVIAEEKALKKEQAKEKRRQAYKNSKK